MAEPGDPHDHDDLIGFTSPSSLAGVGRSRPGTAPLFATSEPTVPTAEKATQRSQAIPEWARETRSAAPSSPRSGDPGYARPAPPEGAMGLYAVYALILFAVPTMGVSAVIALLAVTVRPVPKEPLSASHFLYQKRTLWIGGVGALVGLVLIAAPMGFGVLVLFVLAIWILARGASGALRLASTKPIASPRTWFV